MDVPKIKSACTETIIVSLLKDRSMHGYEMGKEIERRSMGYFALKHSTLYPILHRLEKRGLVAGKWAAIKSGKSRKHYKLTKKGAAYYDENAAAWREFFTTMSLLVPEVAT